MSPPVLAYVIRMFPQLSETFIANEILDLQRLGVDVRVFSYRRPDGVVPHASLQQIKSKITYLPDPLYRSPLEIASAVRDQHSLLGGRFRKLARNALRMSLIKRSLVPVTRLLHAASLANALSGRDAEHLHAHIARGATEVAMLASELTGLPFSFTAHARDVWEAEPEQIIAKIRAAQFVITCTRANQEHLQALVGVDDRSKIKLSYHGVNGAKFSPNDLLSRSETPLVLAVGRLVEKKGFPILLEALALLRDRGIKFRCLIVGEGPQRARLHSIVKDLGLSDRVSIPGSYSQEELVSLYREADLFALPCQVLESGDRDGIPNVLLEAMATGLPVISTDISGIPELIDHGHNGLLVRERDSIALAAAMQLVLHDADLRRRLGANGRATVTGEFDSRDHVEGLARLFAEQVGEAYHEQRQPIETRAAS